MKKNKLFFLFVIVLLCFLENSFAQPFSKKINLADSTQTHVLILKDGTRLVGQISKIEDAKISFFLKKEKEVEQYNLADISIIRVKNDVFNFQKKIESDNHFNNILFFTNTAFSLKKKQHRYMTYWGLSMFYDFGINKNIQFGFGYNFPNHFVGNVKVTGQVNDSYRMGGKLTGSFSPDLFTSQARIIEVGWLHSIGNENRFLNLALNYYNLKTVNNFYNFGEEPIYFPKHFYSFSIGGVWRFSEHWQLMSEKRINFNGAVTEFNFLPNFGIKWFNGKHSVSFGGKSTDDIFLNFFPIIEPEFDFPLGLKTRYLHHLPFFQYARVF